MKAKRGGLKTSLAQSIEIRLTWQQLKAFHGEWSIALQKYFQGHINKLKKTIGDQNSTRLDK
jgi:hypothetical protein